MNHIKNIKEILSIPAGSSGEKTMKRNMSTSGYSSFTDSQLLFGSQFWHENSQSTSQSLSSSSQEGSDPKFTNSYHTKPLLFGELKGKTRALGILEKFEEDRKREKEHNESELLAKERQHTREILNNIQQLVTCAEKNTAVCQTVLVALEKNLSGLQSDISQHFKTVVDQVSSHSKAMAELEESVKKSADATAELGSNLQCLKSSLESLKEEQERESKMLEEALNKLSSLISEHAAKISSQTVMDSTTQSSPGLEQSLLSVLQSNQLGGTRLTHTLSSVEKKLVNVPPQKPVLSIKKRKLSLWGHRKRKKRALVLSQKSKRTVLDENSPSLLNSNKEQNVSSPFIECCNENTVTPRQTLNLDHQSVVCSEKSSKSARCLINPFSCWSQDNDSPVSLDGVERILENLSAERTGAPVKPQGFWQLFDMDCD
ncbi:interactor of HORMAD1 protein 1 [Solea solea]|uniref:interactor of HORMAD1 protein 1 n=1 Tax=Solea solea TaxID=90069 RepID=UPI002729FB57|nr:interactor of HORMAD1 protein 1 [Solea solea]XP_058486499.1 interactor of HORMAD1 protein 1 [Solea solea]